MLDSVKMLMKKDSSIFLKLDLASSSSSAFKLEHWVSWLEEKLAEDLEMMKKQKTASGKSA